MSETKTTRFGGFWLFDSLSSEMATSDEQALVRDRVISYLTACRVVSDDHEIGKFVKKQCELHAVLDNQELANFAKQYNLSLEGADQLVRVGYERNILENIGNDVGRQKYGPTVDQSRLQLLIQYLFEENAFDWRSVIWQDMRVVTLANGFRFYLVRRSSYTDRFEQGILLNHDNQTIALVFWNVNPGLVAPLLNGTDTQPHFYNVEQWQDIGVKLKRWEVIIASYLALLFGVAYFVTDYIYDFYVDTWQTFSWSAIMIASLLPAGWLLRKECRLRKIDKKTGLLKYFDYSEYNPDCLVMRYRRRM